MKAYTVDLRERIVKAVEGGMNKTEASRVYQVSLNSVKRYVKQFKDSGQLEPKPIPGRPAAIIGEKQALLLQEVKANPDATLQERAEYWEQTQGLKLSRSTFSRSLKRLKLTYKKKPESQ